MVRQADHYIIGKFPPEPADHSLFAHSVLTSLGWARGSSAVELIVTHGINEAFMYSRARLHQEQTGREVDWARSQIEKFEGAHTGTLVSLFYK